jgi:hypothetical protein
MEASIIREGSAKVANVETYLDKLVLSHPLRDPVIRQAIRALELPTGSRGLDWFREAGFAEPTARTVVGTLQAPLDHGIRRALISLFGMLWGEMQTKMVRADREEYQRLADPESPDFILDSADYYAFFTYSMFEGRVARDERMMTERDPDPCQAETDS